jgi:hypothetical protein
MKKMSTIVAAAALAAAPSVFAAGDYELKAEIPFAFQVGTQAMPAGTYQFKIDLASDQVEVRGESVRANAVTTLMTRLAAVPHPSGTEHPHIVFDQVGNTSTLSELWEPGIDGFLVHATRGTHEHRVVHVTR